MRIRDVRIHSKNRESKNRSPNVWRTIFVLLFHGPTISGASVKHMDQGVMTHSRVIVLLTLNTFIYKAFCLRRSRVQNVVSVPL